MPTLHELAEAQKAASVAAAEAELPLLDRALAILNSKGVSKAVEDLIALRSEIPETIDTHAQLGYVIDVINNVRNVNLANRVEGLRNALEKLKPSATPEDQAGGEAG